MSTAVIGATGRVGSQIVRGLLARGDPVAALVRVGYIRCGWFMQVERHERGIHALCPGSENVTIRAVPAGCGA